MATNKKSFVLYTDIIHTFEELSNEEAGILVKHILRYVNDLNPNAPDKITKVAFEPIKQQLKRDLKKYEVIIEKRSEAGKKSAQLRNSTLVNISQHKSTSVNTSKHKSTVNVNDTVNEINNISNPSDARSSDCTKFVNYFNSIGDRKFKSNDKLKISLKSRLKEYSKEELKVAVLNAHSDNYHISTNFKYLTPEFILRPEKLEKFLNAPKEDLNESKGYKPEIPN